MNLNERAQQGEIGSSDRSRRNFGTHPANSLTKNKANPLWSANRLLKTAIAEGLPGERIVDGQVPDSLKDYTVYSLDMGSLLAGTKFRGDFEGRIKGILKKLKVEKKWSFFIDEIHTLVDRFDKWWVNGCLESFKARFGQWRCDLHGFNNAQWIWPALWKEQVPWSTVQKIDVNKPAAKTVLKFCWGSKIRKFSQCHLWRCGPERSDWFIQKHIQETLTWQSHGCHWQDRQLFYQMLNQKSAQPRTEALHIGAEEIETV